MKCSAKNVFTWSSRSEAARKKCSVKKVFYKISQTS